MKVIVQKILTEPAVAIGLLLTVVLGVVALTGEGIHDLEDVLTVAAPFLTALGIRPLVTPVAALGSTDDLEKLIGGLPKDVPGNKQSGE